MEALKYYTSTKKREHVFPLLHLLNILMLDHNYKRSTIHSTIEELEDKVLVIPVKAACLSLINNTINSIEDLQPRFSLRTSFWNLGLKDIIQVHKIIQLITWYEFSFNKFHRIWELWTTKRLKWNLIPSLKAWKKTKKMFLNFSTTGTFSRYAVPSNFPWLSKLEGAVRSNSGKSKDTIKHEANWIVVVNPYAQLSQSFSARLPFDTTTTVAQLYKAAEKEFSIPGENRNRLRVILCQFWCNCDAVASKLA